MINQYASHRLWYLVKKDGCYKIKNCHSGNVLNSWGTYVGKGTATMETEVDDKQQYASHRLWYFVAVYDKK